MAQRPPGRAAQTGDITVRTIDLNGDFTALNSGAGAVRVDGEPIHCVEYRDRGVVLAATGVAADASMWMDRLVRGAAELLARDPETPILALEYLIPRESEIDWDATLRQLETTYSVEERLGVAKYSGLQQVAPTHTHAQLAKV